MEPVVTAGLIGAGASILGTGANAVVNSNGHRHSQYRAARLQKQLTDYNYDLQMAAWNKQNEYNSPSAQMQRYKDAGLNPNLIYGQDNTNGSLVSPNGGSVSAEYTPVDFTRSIDSYTQLAQNQLYAKQTQSNVDLQKSQADKNSADTALALLNGMKLNYEKPYWAENAKYDSQYKELAVKNAKTESFQKLYDFLVTNPAKVRNMEANTNLISDQQAKIKAEIASINQDRTLSYKERERKIRLLDKELEWYDKMHQLQANQIGNQVFSTWMQNQFDLDTYNERVRQTKYNSDIMGVEADWKNTEKWLEAITGPVRTAGAIAGGALIGKSFGGVKTPTIKYNSRSGSPKPLRPIHY